MTSGGGYSWVIQDGGNNTLHGTFASRLLGKQKSVPTVARIPSGITN